MSRLPEPTSPPRPQLHRVRLAGPWSLRPWHVAAVAVVAVLAGSLVAFAVLELGVGMEWTPMTAAIGAAVVAALPLALLLGLAVREPTDPQAIGHAAQALDAGNAASAREQFMALAEREFARSRRYGVGAALLLVDVDRFRRLTEDHGAGMGEMLLREVAASAQGTLRGVDALARFGPGQIAVFVAHADALGALDVAERVRERVEQIELTGREQRLRATVSVGVVLMRPAHLSLQAVLEDAEAALGAARQAGGNCVRAVPVDRRRLPQGWRGPSVGDNQAAGS